MPAALHTPLVHQPPPPYPSHLLLIVDTQRPPDFHQHLIGPNPPEEISSELDMLADLYQGDDQLVGETQRNIPSEDDDGMEWTIWLLSTMAMRYTSH